ncbi:MAG TPA: DUF1269 domain-containing protein [Arachnia sp.]|nr:DUF1269 domain-containing protein [Arachnia sp.]HMT86264.1 DUF1269 domain-containing protein [Arachnia sp.]
MNVVIIGTPSREAGLRVMDQVDLAVAEGLISVDDLAMAYRGDNGKVTLLQTADATAGRGAVKGGALGLLVGALAAPLVPAIAIGAGAGALIGKLRDRGLSDKLMKQTGEALGEYEAVVFVLADQASTLVIGTLVERAIEQGAQVSWDVLPAEAQDLLREALKLENQ